MKKVLLINPPLYFSKGLPYSIDNSVPPLGLLYLASYINKYSKMIKAKVIDISVEKMSLEELANIIKKEKPFVTGISSMTPQLQGAVELANFLKQNFNKIKIFLGGPHISADPDFIKRHVHLFDYGITGESEITLLESLEKLIAGKKIPKIQAGKVVMNLDTIPFPDRSLIKREKYSQHESMMFSRGCPYHCYYCSRPSISKKIRYRSAKNMVDEIKLAYSDCQGRIDFQDDTFTLNRKKVIDFCTRVIKEDLKINWHCQSRIDLVDDEVLRAMAKAGCSLIHFGIESGNEKLRREVVNKGSFSNKKIFEVFKSCRKQRIKTAAYFMIGHPGETWEELEDTREMIFKLKPDILGLSIPTPFPGSQLYEIAVKDGIINEKIIDAFANKELGEGYSGVYPVFFPKEVTKEELYAFMKNINRKFYINFYTFWVHLREDITSLERLKRDLSDLLSLILRGVSARKPYVEKSKK